MWKRPMRMMPQPWFFCSPVIENVAQLMPPLLYLLTNFNNFTPNREQLYTNTFQTAFTCGKERRSYPGKWIKESALIHTQRLDEVMNERFGETLFVFEPTVGWLGFVRLKTDKLST